MNNNKIIPQQKEKSFNIEYIKKLAKSHWLRTLNEYQIFNESIANLNENSYEDKCCPICNSKFLFYLPYKSRRNVRCYSCGSAGRHRFIYNFFKNYTEIFSKKCSLLHFAPEKVLFNLFEESENIEYVTADLVKKRNVKKQMDMCSIDYPDNYFNYILANHVLEHIPDDNKAMSELYRTVKPYDKKDQNYVILTVPYYRKLKKTFENPEYNTPELRLKYFGQRDHVRKYGPDFTTRLEKVGFDVTETKVSDIYNDKEIYKYGLVKNSPIFICKKL